MLVNTLTANYGYLCSNRQNLQLQIQIKLSKKPQTFCGIFFQYSESTLNFQCSEINMSAICLIFLNIFNPKHVLI